MTDAVPPPGRVRVTGTESKGKGNKRVRIEVADPM